VDLSLRSAVTDDARFVWEVNNHPTVRAQSVSTEAIPWDVHAAWFAKKIGDPSCVFLIGACDGAPAGVVRFDTTGDTTTVSVAVDVRQRGKGIGTQLLARSTDDFLRGPTGSPHRSVHTPDNDASKRAFVAAGYVHTGRGEDRGVQLEKYERTPR